jgi:hypothetical protein
VRRVKLQNYKADVVNKILSQETQGSRGSGCNALSNISIVWNCNVCIEGQSQSMQTFDFKPPTFELYLSKRTRLLNSINDERPFMFEKFLTFLRVIQFLYILCIYLFNLVR